MSAGITLGPMPFDAVVELTETSAIMRNDRVREESSKEWMSAFEVPGLFPGDSDKVSEGGAVSMSGFEVNQTSAEARTQERAAPDEPAASPEVTDGVVRLGKFEVLLGASETPAAKTDDPASALLRAAASLETVEPAVAPPRKAEPATKQVADQRDVSKPDASLEFPNDGIPQLDVPKQPPLSNVFEADSTFEPDTRKTRAPLDLAALVSSGVEDQPAPTIPAPAASLPPFKSPPFKPPVQPWRPPDKRSRQLVVRGCLALVAVAGVWALFTLLKPDMEVATYDQYAAIYLEYQTLTESPDSGSWPEFATRAKAELDETLPNLEATAIPGERSKSLLLYAGRDLRTALDLTPEAANPHAERLAGFFEQLNELHASNE